MGSSLAEFIAESLKEILPANKQIILGPLPDNVAQRLADESGLDLTSYSATIDTYAIRHIMKSHGDVQKAVTADDFELIYQIFTDPDVVFYDGKNRIGRDVIQFQKRIGNRYIILKEVRTGRKQLALNSMRIIKRN